MLFLSFPLSQQLGVIQGCPYTRQRVREKAFITWWRQPCSPGKKDEHPKWGWREKEDGLRKWRGLLLACHDECSTNLECVCVIRGHEIRYVQRGCGACHNFTSWPLTSLSVEVLVTFPNPRNPSGVSQREFHPLLKQWKAYCGHVLKRKKSIKCPHAPCVASFRRRELVQFDSKWRH